MQSVKVKTTGNKTVEVTYDELFSHLLHFCREHFAEKSSEIKIGENAKENPEFSITPIPPKKPKTIPPVIPLTSNQP